MDRRLVTALLLFTVFGFVYGMYNAVQTIPQQPSKVVQKPLPTYIPATTPQTSLVLKKGVSFQNSPQTVPVDVFINTKENKVQAVQLEIAYDPQVLRFVSIKNVYLLSGKQVVVDTIDRVNGRITYGVKSDTPMQGADKIAELVFHKIDNSVDGTEVRLLNQTMVTADGIEDSAAVGLVNTPISLNQ